MLRVDLQIIAEVSAMPDQHSSTGWVAVYKYFNY